jgi:hypothetical protein
VHFYMVRYRLSLLCPYLQVNSQAEATDREGA